MSSFTRVDTSVIGRWWWTVDRYLLAGILALMVGGVVLSFAASPPVAERLDLDSYHFVKRQALFLIPAIALLFGVSLLTPRQVRRVALVVLVGGVMLTILPTLATAIIGA